jgi:hypothetical protein
MHNYSNTLVLTGSLCLTIALVLSWCLVGVGSPTFMKKVFPNYQYLLKAHIGYAGAASTVCYVAIFVL